MAELRVDDEWAEYAKVGVTKLKAEDEVRVSYISIQLDLFPLTTFASFPTPR